MSRKKQRLTQEQLEMIRLLEPLLEGSMTVFGLKDRDHRYLYVNSEIGRLVGIASEDIVGFRPDKFLVPATARAMYEHQEAVMASGQPARYVEQVSFGPHTRTFAMTYFPLGDTPGAVTGVGFIGTLIQDPEWLNAGMQDMLEDAQQTILELRSQLDSAHTQATTDALTGVWNRIQAEVIGQQEISRQDRKHGSVTIIFADIDHFRSINDSWGHAIGDVILKAFCQVLQGCLRGADVLARWGGEEFLLLLPDTDIEKALIVAERIRATVEKHSFPHIGSLTASFGLAAYAQGETWLHWIERADTALHRAKNRGRNRVEMDRAATFQNIPAELAGASGFLRLAWRSSYESGHPLIDAQHRQLFIHANNLLSSFMAGKSQEHLGEMIEGLMDIIIGHFHDEGRLMLECGYPGAESHIQAHQRLHDRAQELYARHQQGRLPAVEFFTFLAYDIVATHMFVEDRAFYPWIAGQPEERPAPERRAAGNGKKTATSAVSAPPATGKPAKKAAKGRAAAAPAAKSGKSAKNGRTARKASAAKSAAKPAGKPAAKSAAKSGATEKTAAKTRPAAKPAAKPAGTSGKRPAKSAKA